MPPSLIKNKKMLKYHQKNKIKNLSNQLSSNHNNSNNNCNNSNLNQKSSLQNKFRIKVKILMIQRNKIISHREETNIKIIDKIIILIVKNLIKIETLLKY